MVINASHGELCARGENRHNVNTPLGTRSPNVYRKFPHVSTYPHCLLQLLTL
jgi:hypothetical protein